nr:hypothetical protein [Tanacetum cinerariifolium]
STYKLDENATRETSKQNVTNEVHKQPSNSQKKGFVDDGINLMTLKNSFESLMEADKVLDIAKPDDNVGPHDENVLEDEDDDVEEVFCGKGRGYQRKAHQYLKNGSKHSHYSSFRCIA